MAEVSNSKISSKNMSKTGKAATTEGAAATSSGKSSKKTSEEALPSPVMHVKESPSSPTVQKTKPSTEKKETTSLKTEVASIADKEAELLGGETEDSEQKSPKPTRSSTGKKVSPSSVVEESKASSKEEAVSAKEEAAPSTEEVEIEVEEEDEEEDPEAKEVLDAMVEARSKKPTTKKPRKVHLDVFKTENRGKKNTSPPASAEPARRNATQTGRESSSDRTHSGSGTSSRYGDRPNRGAGSDERKKSDLPEYGVLWQEGIDIGLISGKKHPNGGIHYHHIFKKNLNDFIKRFKALDGETEADVAEAFETELQFRIKQQKESGNETSTSSYRTDKHSYKKHSSGPGGKPYDKSKRTSHEEEEEHSEMSAALIKLWSKGLDCGLIHQKNQFHRGLPTFITPSELAAQIEEYDALDAERKEEAAADFKRELDTFNASIPPTARYFKVFKTYSRVWEAAEKAGVIPDGYSCKSDYAEWVSPKALICATYTVSSTLTSKKRNLFREGIKEDFASQLSLADETIKYRASLALRKKQDIVKASVDASLHESTQAYRTCTGCVKHLVMEDVISAVSSWRMLGDQEAEDRYMRWHMYRKYTHAKHCVHD
jgi:hypothetical protein